MLTIHVWPRRLKEFLLTHPLYKSPRGGISPTAQQCRVAMPYQGCFSKTARGIRQPPAAQSHNPACVINPSILCLNSPATVS